MSIGHNNYSQQLSYDILDLLDELDQVESGTSRQEILLTQIEHKVNSLRHLMSHGLRQDERKEAEKTLKYTLIQIQKLQDVQRSKILMISSVGVGALSLGAAGCLGMGIYNPASDIANYSKVLEGVSHGAKAISGVPEQTNHSDRTKFEYHIKQAEQKYNADKESAANAAEARRIATEATDRAANLRNNIISTILSVRA